MRRIAIVVTGVVFAVLGPRFSAPQSREAGEPFAYEPPDGFVESNANGNGEEREWVHPSATGPVGPRVTLTTSKSSGTVEPADLAKIARGMPEVLDAGGVTWTDVRHEMRTRPDGTRVGLIEGDCTKRGAEILTGITEEDLHYRRLVFVFPVNGGTAIATALYGKEEIAKWQPVFEATIGKARGVALRVPAPPPWLYSAWGGAGLVLGWLAASLVTKREPVMAPKDDVA